MDVLSLRILLGGLFSGYPVAHHSVSSFPDRQLIVLGGSMHLQDAYPVTSFAVLTPKPSPCRSKAAVRSITFPLKDQIPNCDKAERFGVGIPTIETLHILHIMPEGMQ